MKKLIKLWTSVLCLCVLMSGMPLHAQDELAAPSTISTASEFIGDISLPDLHEDVFYKLLDQETDRIIERMGPALLKEEAKGLMKIKEKILRLLKSLNMWEHAKHLFMRHGIGVAATSAISEVVTVFVLPPLFVGLGWNLAAVAFGAIPSPLYMIPAYLAITNLRNKSKLAKEMGYSLAQVMALDKFRRELIGFSINNRILDLVVEDLNGDQSITIIKRSFARWRGGLSGNLVDLNEIETMVKEGIGAHKLQILKDFAHGDEAVYANMLMQEINRDAKMKMDFHNIVHERIDMDLDQRVHQRIYQMYDHQNVISRSRGTLREFKSEAISEIKKYDLDTKANKEIISDFTAQLSAELDALDHEIKIFEYQYLNSIRIGQEFEDNFFVAKSQKIYERLNVIQAGIDAGQRQLQATNHSASALSAQKFIDLQADTNKRYRFFGFSLRTGDSCHDMMQGLRRRLERIALR